MTKKAVILNGVSQPTRGREGTVARLDVVRYIISMVPNVVHSSSPLDQVASAAGLRAANSSTSNIAREGVSRDSIKSEIRAKADSAGGTKSQIRSSIQGGGSSGGAGMQTAGFSMTQEHLNEFQRANVDSVKRFTV